jgi:hypothetical protein
MNWEISEESAREMNDYVDDCLQGLRKLTKVRSHDKRDSKEPLPPKKKESRMLPLRQPARLRFIIPVIVLASVALEFWPGHCNPLGHIQSMA